MLKPVSASLASLLLISTIPFLLQTAYGQQTITSNSATNSTQWTTYTDKNLGLSIQYPADWKNENKNENRFADSDLTLTSPVGQSAFVYITINKIGLSKDMAPEFKDNILGHFNYLIYTETTTDPNTRQIEDFNFTRYTIGSEKAIASVFATDKSDAATEQITTVHKLNGYQILVVFIPQTSFDLKESQELRSKIMSSIKWLD